jgi:hypothetical protein
MTSHNMSQPVSQVGVGGMKGKERQDGSSEVLSVSGLGFISSFGTGLLTFCETLSGSLGFKLSLYSTNRRCWCPHAPGEKFATFPFLHYPVIPSSFHSSGQSSITWRK